MLDTEQSKSFNPAWINVQLPRYFYIYWNLDMRHAFSQNHYTNRFC